MWARRISRSRRHAVRRSTLDWCLSNAKINASDDDPRIGTVNSRSLSPLRITSYTSRVEAVAGL